jgi:hypothetical protein
LKDNVDWIECFKSVAHWASRPLLLRNALQVVRTEFETSGDETKDFAQVALAATPNDLKAVLALQPERINRHSARDKSDIQRGESLTLLDKHTKTAGGSLIFKRFHSKKTEKGL